MLINRKKQSVFCSIFAALWHIRSFLLSLLYLRFFFVLHFSHKHFSLFFSPLWHFLLIFLEIFLLSLNVLPTAKFNPNRSVFLVHIRKRKFSTIDLLFNIFIFSGIFIIDNRFLENVTIPLILLALNKQLWKRWYFNSFIANIYFDCLFNGVVLLKINQTTDIERISRIERMLFFLKSGASQEIPSSDITCIETSFNKHFIGYKRPCIKMAVIEKNKKKKKQTKTKKR